MDLRRIVLGILISLTLTNVVAQRMEEMEFRDQEIVDVLLVLAQISGKSIIPDETVRGKASYFFTDTDFDTALDAFLSTYKLYMKKEGQILYISRIKSEWDETAKLVTLEAEDVEVRSLIRALSRTVGKTILYDSLPPEKITVHLKRVSLKDALQVLIRQFTEYQLETKDQYHYIQRIPMNNDGSRSATRGSQLLLQEGSFYSINQPKVRFREVLEELFRKEGKEYALFVRGDSLIENLRFTHKSFQEMLTLILSQADADYSIHNGIYNIINIDKREVLKKFKSVVTIPLNYIATDDIPRLMPAGLASSSLYKLDKAENRIILSGSTQELAPVLDFLKEIDVPLSGRSYYRFNFSHIKADQVVNLLPPSLKGAPPIIHPETNSGLFLLTPGKKEHLEAYLELIDKPVQVTPITLKYIKAQDLMEHLPPSVTKDDFVPTTDTRRVLFKGTQDKLEAFMKDLDVFDKPMPQIRYDLLVVQYGESEGFNWGNEDDQFLTFNKTNAEPAYGLVGSVGSALTMNLDAISTLGYQFVAKLDISMKNERSRIMADTTLKGLSGQKVSFQSTHTTRYKDLEYDEEGNPLGTGVTRELSSGLFIDLEGWVSGQEMITMTVSGKVSKEGGGDSDNNAPNTDEQVVNTQVRTRSGEAVRIGGLRQQTVSITDYKTPILGHIPWLGKLFTRQVESTDELEFSIYIIPYLEFDEPQEKIIPEEHIRRIYQNLEGLF